MTKICPDTHKHAENTTCYHTCGCRCDECREGARVREARRKRTMAYGRYRGRQPIIGVVRRIHGLHYLGWTTAHIAEVSGLDRKYLDDIHRGKWVMPETFDAVDEAYRTLVLRGAGPSTRSAAYARRQGWVSPLSWEDIDEDPRPVKTVKDRTLRGDKLYDEIEHLRGAGESAHQIAKALGKTTDALYQAAYARGRLEMANFFRQAARTERASEYGAEHRERGAA